MRSVDDDGIMKNIVWLCNAMTIAIMYGALCVYTHNRNSTAYMHVLHVSDAYTHKLCEI